MPTKMTQIQCNPYQKFKGIFMEIEPKPKIHGTTKDPVTQYA